MGEEIPADLAMGDAAQPITAIELCGILQALGDSLVKLSYTLANDVIAASGLVERFRQVGQCLANVERRLPGTGQTPTSS